MKVTQLKIPANIKVVFFDMDHTLIDTDSDLSWKEFLAEKKMTGIKAKLWGQWFFLTYKLNKLNTDRFLKFQLKEFIGKTAEEMEPLFKEHYDRKVKDFFYPEIVTLIKELQAKKTKVVILTATNRHIAAPLAKHLNIKWLLGTVLEIIDNKFTGKIIPPYCFQNGKVHYMDSWLNEHKINKKDTAYFGDSTSDIQTLHNVGFSVAVNPSKILLNEANKMGWNIVETS